MPEQSRSPLALLLELGLDAAGERPARAGRNPYPPARQPRRDVGRTQPVAVHGLLGRIADRALDILARADRAVERHGIADRAEAFDARAASPLEPLLGGIQRRLQRRAGEKA